MKAIVCEMCNSKDIIKQDGYYVCQCCNTKYSVEEAKKLMIDGEVSVKGINSIEEEIKNVYKLIEIGELDKAHSILESLVSKAPRNSEVWLAYAKYSEKYYLSDDYLFSHCGYPCGYQNYLCYCENHERLLEKIEYYKKSADSSYESKFNEIINNVISLKSDIEKELIEIVKNNWKSFEYCNVVFDKEFDRLLFDWDGKSYCIKSNNKTFLGEFCRTVIHNHKTLEDFFKDGSKRTEQLKFLYYVGGDKKAIEILRADYDDSKETRQHLNRYGYCFPNRIRIWSRECAWSDTNELIVDLKMKYPILDNLDEIIKESEKIPKKFVKPQKSNGGCYVATSIYGSYDCPQVWTLRRFRDYTLAETWYGRAFIYTYYTISPTIVKWFGETKWFKKMWRSKLDKMVYKLNEKGVENTPYEDKKW